MAFAIRSPAFQNGAAIPSAYAKDGNNISPPLEWTGAPEGTRSFALLVEDPDAPSGMFRHWAIFDIPPETTVLGEGEDVSALGKGINDFGNDGYDGPKPPKGHGVHHYHFRLAALDTERLKDVDDEVSAVAVWDEALRHVIEEAELVGTYETK